MFKGVDVLQVQSQYAQLHHALPELPVGVGPGVGVEGNGFVWLVFQNIPDQVGQRCPGTEFDEDPSAGPVEVLDLLPE